MRVATFYDLPDIPGSDHASVYIVDPSDKVEIRQVKLGVDTANDVEILSGLQEGEQVIVSDRASLTSGQQVHPQLVPPEAYKNKS